MIVIFVGLTYQSSLLCPESEFEAKAEANRSVLNLLCIQFLCIFQYFSSINVKWGRKHRAIQYNMIAKFKGQCFQTIFTVKISQFCGSTSGADCSIQPRVYIQLDALARRLPVSTATGERWTEDLCHWFGALPSLQFRRLIGSTFNYDFFFLITAPHRGDVIAF